MRVAGIIAEYNPFHNGHMRHIEITRRELGCDYVIAVMNGSFSQRGEPMALSKWTRTRMALLCGVDAVIELPALYGIMPAEGFARGGVRLLHALGCVDAISFGCETGDIHALTRVADVLLREPEEYREKLRFALSEGKSFARARGEALTAFLGDGAEWLREPNAALAIEYLRENQRASRPLHALAVPRVVSHNETELSAETSASAIRAALKRGEIDAVRACVPEPAYAEIMSAYEKEAPREEALDDLTIYALRAMNRERLSRLPDMSEGLEGRLLALSGECSGRSELLAALKCKRYPYARLSRMLAQALLGGDASLAASRPDPPYARILGFRRSASPLIARMRETSAISVADRPKALEADPVFAFETHTTDVRALLSRSPEERRSHSDYTRRLVVV